MSEKCDHIQSVSCFYLHDLLQQKKLEQQMFGSIEHFRQHYQMAEQIGRGAFAICYKAIHNLTSKVVAVKKISVLTDNIHNNNNLSIIDNQVKLLESLSHTNIINFIAAYKAKKYALIVTDYQQGRDLQQKITELKKQNKRLIEKQIYNIFGQLLQGIAYLHQKNIIHRDIKPSNIFIDSTDNVKIGDLGAAKIVEQFNFTRIGTPYYLPPELIRHENYSFSADIWSLGITLYHLVYLQLPFKASNVIKLGQLIVQSQPQYEQGTYNWIQKAVKSMLMKDEKKRPTAKELLDQYFKNQAMIEISKCKYEVINLQVKQEIKVEVEKQTQNEDEKEENPFYDEGTSKQIQICKSVIQNTDNVQSFYSDNFVPPHPIKIKRITKTDHHRFLERNFSHIDKQAIDQNQSTIILSVNPVQSRKQSIVTPASTHKKTFLVNQSFSDCKNYKKISCFKETSRPQSQSISNFFQQQPNDKTRMNFIGHRREPSAIQKKVKHRELMQKIKPLKIQSGEGRQNFESAQKFEKPKITIDSPSFVLMR